MEARTVPRAAPAGVTGFASASPRLLRVASDAHLVELIRQGRGAAFEALYDRHHRAILSFCRHMLGSAEEAEDAVQHTFLAAYNDLIASDREMHLRAWLFTIARNRCYTVLRARREQPIADLDEPATEGLATQVERRQDLRDLVFDLGRLPDDQRAALVLSEMDSLTHEQIAEVLDVPKDKVKALVFQARESLIASRTARETDCSVIREQLANLRGGALRRGNLRRHLRECPGCREFREEVDRQRKAMRVLLPVVPTLALKETVLGATAGGTATGTAAAVGAGAVGGGTVAGSVFKGGVIKSLIGAAVAGVGTAGTIVAVHDFQVGNGATPQRNATVAPARLQAPPAAAHRARHAVAVSSSTGLLAASPGAQRYAATSRSSASWSAAASGHVRSSSSTPVAVLHPFSSSGLAGSKPASNPLGPSTPTVGVTPPSAPTGSGNAPYLGSSAFGTKAQPAPSAPSASSTSTPSTSGSSSSATPIPITSSPEPSGSTTSGSTHTTTGTSGSGGGHFASPTGSGSTTPSNGGSSTRTGSSGSTGTTQTSTPSTSSSSSGSTPSTTSTSTTSTSSTSTSSQPTGTGGRSGSTGTGTSSTSSGSASGEYGGGSNPGGGGR